MDNWKSGQPAVNIFGDGMVEIWRSGTSPIVLDTNILTNSFVEVFARGFLPYEVLAGGYVISLTFKEVSCAGEVRNTTPELIVSGYVAGTGFSTGGRIYPRPMVLLPPAERLIPIID